MEKRVYAKPVLESETFVPQYYIAACGDPEGIKYLFTCDAPAGTLYYYNDRGNPQRIGSYHPCSKEHEAPRDGEFPYGFVDFNRNKKEDPGEAVRVWIERGWLGNIRNAHATTKLDEQSWGTTAKS